jgi:heme/copper-type cytochrome/quinol oxidase subunit 2
MPTHLLLHSATLWVSATLGLCAAVAVVVFGVMIHSIATFRRTGDRTGLAPGRRLAEILWAFVPIAIMSAMATPAVRTAMSSPPQSERVAQSETHSEPRAETLLAIGAAGYNADRR